MPELNPWAPMQDNNNGKAKAKGKGKGKSKCAACYELMTRMESLEIAVATLKETVEKLDHAYQHTSILDGGSSESKQPTPSDDGTE